MKLTVFQSAKGDCLLLTSEDSKHMLVDGGMRDSYSEYVAPALGQLRVDGGSLDVVYVSHIDEDHISGVLQLMDDEVAWRIHEFQQKNGNPQHKEPDCRRPPKVGAIWHNAFHEQLSENAGEIEEMLAASAAILSGSENKAVKELASAQNELVTSIGDALKLTKRVAPDQLGIKLNAPAKGKLMLVRTATSPAIKLGLMRLSIIGPFRADLEKLRKEWDEWLKKNQTQLQSIRARAKKDEAQFSVKEINDILSPKLTQASVLSELLPLEETAKPFKLGDRKKVTTPNLASLMFFVEEKGKTLLLTGDGHHLDILNGLKHIKQLKGTNGLHVDVLKVQHHGSEHNLDEAFCRMITADHYIFCGNGENKNPDLRVLQAIADSRFGSSTQLSPNSEASRPFKFWFNSHATVTKKKEAKDHMQEVEKLVGKLAQKSNGQMSFFFLKGSSFDLQIGNHI
ncbi:MAG TPA: MBL fold metallo-hydrolase [Anaerolineales bacterium]|nr:MBL fold metallo-hydrolase [Anaerolineales bacterium]